MGDDKFFGTNDISTSSRNPRSLDGVKSLSRRLLIIASTLFQREGQADRYKGKGVAPSVRFTGEYMREKVFQCLVVITRESTSCLILFFR